jgi:hypothetical protein
MLSALKVKSVSPPVGQNWSGTEPLPEKTSKRRVGNPAAPVGWASAWRFR